MSNFYFLDRWPNLKKLGMQAENYITTDSNASMLKTRILGEQLIDLVLVALKVEVDKFATQDDKIKKLRTININQSIPDWFNIDSMKGMISKGVFENVEFMCPPTELQNEFGDIFDKINEMKNKCEEELLGLNNLFNSLMQRAFNGEL